VAIGAHRCPSAGRRLVWSVSPTSRGDYSLLDDDEEHTPFSVTSGAVTEVATSRCAP
jgi:hypothetical protein